MKVLVHEEDKATTVIVPDYQLSLAIGKRGQNARLAAKLTGWKIDIKSETEAMEEGLLSDTDEKEGRLEIEENLDYDSSYEEMDEDLFK